MGEFWGKILLVAVAAAWPVYRLIQAERRRIKNNRAPEIFAEAVVTGKRNGSYDGHQNLSQPYLRDGGTAYYVTIALEDGREMELLAAQSLYGRLREGVRGQAYYQGEKLLGFQEEDTE